MALSDRDQAILEFEQGWWLAPGSKESAIRNMLGMSATRYRGLLHDLIDDDDALAFDPLLIRRLRKARDRRRQGRSDGRSAGEPPSR